ncbi:MAG: hypothetical protein GXP30_11650 [Verrucomicrobia bacterium]|nr:hypothetical protein [Verrucomicrobiota bacterium]
MKKIKIIGLLAIGLLVVAGLVFFALQDPFPRLDLSKGDTHLLAVILETPKAPNPETTEYPDCLSVAKVQVLKVMEGKGVPLEMLVAFPVITKRKLTEAAFYKAGDFVEFTLLEQGQEEDSLLSMQRIMDIDDFSLELFYAEGLWRWTPEVVDLVLSASDVLSAK